MKRRILLKVVYHTTEGVTELGTYRATERDFSDGGGTIIIDRKRFRRFVESQGWEPHAELQLPRGYSRPEPYRYTRGGYFTHDISRRIFTV